jgi:hydrogenase nickel incorporation protein HypA/HybF
VHELSIAVALVDLAAEEAERRGARVVAAHVKVGVLSGVVKDALISAYEMASEGTALEGTALVIDEVPSVIRCVVCQQERATRPHSWFLCDVCGTTATELVHGRELELAALELE